MHPQSDEPHLILRQRSVDSEAYNHNGEIMGQKLVPCERKNLLGEPTLGMLLDSVAVGEPGILTGTWCGSGKCATGERATEDEGGVHRCRR